MTDGRRSGLASFERRGGHWKPPEGGRTRATYPRPRSHGQTHLHGKLRTKRERMAFSGDAGGSCWPHAVIAQPA
jgi:hypothetical protein